MRGWIAGAALALGCLAAVPAVAVEREDVMRPCKRQDLIGVWRVLRLGVTGGRTIDRTDPAFLPHQRYVFHSNATMAHATPASGRTNCRMKSPCPILRRIPMRGAIRRP